MAGDNQNMQTNAFLYLGAENWAHPAWHRDFYPDGLPEDWMLSFYNTQFQMVFLPVAVWSKASPDNWRQWLNDTQEGFVFVLEKGDDAEPPRDARVLAPSPAWLNAHVWWLDEAPDMRALAGRIAEHAANGEPLFVISRRGDLGLLRQAEALRQVMGY
ncbi:MAG: hypothetical protein AB1593_05100 [Pseudomonadota bacterium]